MWTIELVAGVRGPTGTLERANSEDVERGGGVGRKLALSEYEQVGQSDSFSEAGRHQ